MQKNNKSIISSEEQLKRIIQSDSLHLFTDTAYIADIIKMGKTSKKIFENAKLYITNNEKDLMDLENNNMKIAIGIDIINSLLTKDSSSINENTKYRHRLSPNSIVSIYYNLYNDDKRIETIFTNSIVIRDTMDSLRINILRSQALIDSLNQISGDIEPPLNENSKIVNEYPGNEFSDKMYDAKQSIVNSHKLYKEYEKKLNEQRAEVILRNIVIPSYLNHSYIEEAINPPIRNNYLITTIGIFILSLLLSYICFRFILFRFFIYDK